MDCVLDDDNENYAVKTETTEECENTENYSKAPLAYSDNSEYVNMKTRGSWKSSEKCFVAQQCDLKDIDRKVIAKIEPSEVCNASDNCLVRQCKQSDKMALQLSNVKKEDRVNVHKYETKMKMDQNAVKKQDYSNNYRHAETSSHSMDDEQLMNSVAECYGYQRSTENGDFHSSSGHQLPSVCEHSHQRSTQRCVSPGHVHTSSVTRPGLPVYASRSDFLHSTGGYLLAGDTLVSRLRLFLQSRREMLSLGPQLAGMRGLPGATVRSLRRTFCSLQPGTYRVVVLSIGSNDLCNYTTSARQVADDLIDLAELLHRRGVETVYLFEILHRNSELHMIGRSVVEYNRAVDEVNGRVKEHCVNGHTVFWKHSHGTKGSQHRLEDGIHPTERGLMAFRHCVFRAFKHSLR